jgi:deoxyribodipyrimidine photo-lyase
MSSPALVWLRDDLRIADNPALVAAVRTGWPVVCVYIYDQVSAGVRPLGGAALWWLHHSLKALNERLSAIGGKLHLFEGAAEKVLEKIAADIQPAAVFWNRRYGGAERALDERLKGALKARGLEVQSFKAHVLVEPWEIATQSGGPFRVYSPFWKAMQAMGEPDAPLSAPTRMEALAYEGGVALDALRLLPTKPDWAGGMRGAWTPGEMGAKARLDTFLRDGGKNYAEDRDRPDLPSTSMLSPYLRFGEISPRQVWHATRFAEAERTISNRHALKFLSEVAWREFAFHLLYHAPDLAFKNWNSRFDAFPWEPDDGLLLAWQRGQTGYPIVDAGMRQLWQTGWMHNRVRMITASLLVKHFLQDWRLGEQWFWDTLVDACPANNAASWQWVAGSGADAAPYFRIFNPILQGEKFDPKGDFVRRYVPELARLPNSVLHKPWEASPQVLRDAGVVLGQTYPHPVVDHHKGRERALVAFSALPSSS